MSPTPRRDNAGNGATSMALTPAATVVGLSILALLVRACLAAQGGLWRDEGLFLFVARMESWSVMLDFLRYSESHPPLFYGIMRLWMSAAGASDAAARVLPVLLGVALVPVIYLVGASLFSARVALLSATLVALSPALAEHAALVRPYSFLPFLALISCYSLIRGLEGGSARFWLAHALATLAMLYTHNWSILVLGGQWFATLCVLSSPALQAARSVIRPWAVAQLAILICYLPWMPTLVHQARHAGHAPRLLADAAEHLSFAIQGLRWFLGATIVGYAPVGDGAVLAASARVLAALITITVLVLVVVRLRPLRPTGAGPQFEDASLAGPKVYGLPLMILVGVPISAWLAALLLSPRSNLLLTRCLVTLAPMMILALAYWLAKPRTGTLATLYAAATGLLLSIYGASLYALSDGTRSNARELAKGVGARTAASDLLIIAPEWLASSFNLYYAPDVEQINFPHFGREGAISHSGVRARTIDPAALERVKARVAESRKAGRRVWLITERDAVLDLAPEDMAAAVNSRSYGFAGIARANQIRFELVAQYGLPDTSLTTGTAPARFEHLRAYLFSAPARPR